MFKTKTIKVKSIKKKKTFLFKKYNSKIVTFKKQREENKLMTMMMWELSMYVGMYIEHDVCN